MKTLLALLPIVLGFAFAPLSANAQSDVKSPITDSTKKAADTAKTKVADKVKTTKAKASDTATSAKTKAADAATKAADPAKTAKSKVADSVKEKTAAVKDAKPKAIAAKPGSHQSVPSKELVALAEKEIGGLTSAKKTALTKLLNSGSQEDLIKVPGIGETIAGNIIKSRPFAKPTDLVNVNGIGEAKVKSVVAYINDPAAAAKADTTPKTKKN